MRKLIQTISNSDPWLSALVIGCLAVAIGCYALSREATAIPPGKTVVTFCKGGLKRDRVEAEVLRQAFEAKNPDIHLNIINSNVTRKADTMIAAGDPPDLVQTACDLVDYYIEAGAIQDLAPFVENDPELRKIFGRILFDDPSDEPPDMIEAMVRPFLRIEDGRKRLYALPVNYTPFIVYYNKDLFDRYGVPYPTENWDWDDLREKAIALTRDDQGRRPDQPGFDPTRVVSYGFTYAWWQHGVECFVRQNGGRFVNDEGTRVVADEPATVEAMQFLFDLKHKDGVVPIGQSGLRSISFAEGSVGMQLTGVFFVSTLNDSATDLDWDVAPLPRGRGGKRASVIFPNGWALTTGAKSPEAAIKYLKFLVSEEGMTIAENPVFLPTRRSVLAKRGLFDPTKRPFSRWALTHDIDVGYAQPPYATKQYYGDVYDVVNEYLQKLLLTVNPPLTPEEAAHEMTYWGNVVLERDRTITGTRRFGLLALAAALAPMLYLIYLFVRPRRKALSRLQRREERWGLALISPWLLGFVIFSAFPILVSITLSFSQWTSLSSFTAAEFTGVENYRVALSGEDPKFWTSLWVTFRYALLAVPTGLVAGFAMAVLMNQSVKGIALFRTIYYIPAVLPSVAAAVLWWRLFDQNNGWVNVVIEWLNYRGWITQLTLQWLGPDTYPVGWLSNESVVPFVFVIMALWSVGGGMIIYLAGLQSIPTQLYEAAEIDGAGRWRRLCDVTLPMLSPVIFFNLIMGVIGSFQVFNVAYVLFDGSTGPSDSALFYGLHLFREAFTKYRLGYASALAWILFVIILAFTVLIFKSSPMWVYYESARQKRA